MKKREMFYLTGLLCALTLTACGGQTETETSEPAVLEQQENEENTEPAAEENGEVKEAETEEQQEEASSDSSILIAYFTWADNTIVEDQEASLESALSHYESMGDADRYGTDAISSASILEPGNAARIAGWIQEETGGELFSIVAEEPYPSDYDECMERASQEKAEDERPALATHVEDFSDYDVIFIGFPNWWSSLPMPVLTFLEEYDFSGKTVIPFCTHGTGGIAATVRELRDALPDTAQVLEPIGVYRAEVLDAQPQVQEWLSELGYE
ncbi:MAG: flavodoxin [Eubacteriales bacterium]|nr:flavodoxin [Eubacteriales bacterium]